jgi:hypothetical protein
MLARLVVEVLIFFGLLFVSPSIVGATPSHKFPNIDKLECTTSEDEFVIACFSDKTMITSLPVERYALLYQFVEGHFPTVERDNTKLYVIVESLPKYMKRMGKRYPEETMSMVQGGTVIRGYTYKSEVDDDAVIG